MKIRIRGNSIRYRLDKADIATLQEQQQVAEVTTIGAGTLHFSIHARAGVPAIKLEPNGVQLFLPVEQVAAWITTEQVGFKHELPNADGSVLHLLIEKDFKCLTERDEDESQAFENPAQRC
ncbi:DUF7009 family protein [Chitinophaga silvisoli]|uniref:Uncharacterized protein n=1 Tax=Chitinophaga silvisoli TaxID=2291814 RepID=A0A3E1P526_9BACT|nr:hypothetical protein [Chitinophaga silvisoli]RFM35098.1 hypothetical protein DXN04_06790 [Chitinophaga silvisoli]